MKTMITIAIVSLLMAGCAGSKRPDVQTLGDGYELPEPGVGQGGPAYQTEQEDDDVAKADALAVIEGYEPLYGITEPPPAGVELLPEWVVSDAVLVSWYCLLYTSPSPRDQRGSRMPSSA